MPHQVLILLAAGGLMFLVIGCLAALSHYYTLSGIKSKTVGDGQHGTARWATAKEIRQTYAHVPFEVKKWRSGQNLPAEQGLVLGCKGKKGELTALVDSDDIHCLMIGASGIGKTAYFLYPNLEYACASGMSWLALDSKGDLARNYGAIAKNCYGYQNVAVIDLRNPTRSDGNNLLTLVIRYMDIARNDPNNLAARAKAEKYAKILSKTIVNPDGDDSNRGQNAFFYDAAEGLLTSVILMLAEFLPPDKDHLQERRHIVSVFKLVQDLLEPSRVKGKSHFQLLMAKLPPDHKARWFAGAALNSAEQAMASVMSTVLSRLNAFLDSELEQILCFDTAIDAETFCNEKSAIFIVLPEEDQTKYFMVSLILQNLYREILTIADELGGRLKNRVVFFADELGTCPPIQSLELCHEGLEHIPGIELRDLVHLDIIPFGCRQIRCGDLLGGYSVETVEKVRGLGAGGIALGAEHGLRQLLRHGFRLGKGQGLDYVSLLPFREVAPLLPIHCREKLVRIELLDYISQIGGQGPSYETGGIGGAFLRFVGSQLRVRSCGSDSLVSAHSHPEGHVREHRVHQCGNRHCKHLLAVLRA